MNLSILHKISDFVKENNISISGVYYKFPSDFPEAFKRTVNNYLQRAYSKYIIKGKIDEFYIGFDNNKNAYLQFIGKIQDPNDVGDIKKVKEVRVLVFEDWVEYDFAFDSSSIIKENIFLENIKNLDNALYLEAHNNISIDFKNRFFRDYIEGKPIEKYYEELCDNIINYIQYLNNENNLSYKLLDEEIKDAKEIEKIYFFENENTNEERISKDKLSNPQTQRKNAEIPLSERLESLDSFSPEDEIEANSKNSSAVYYVKIFNIKGKYKLIMEPKEPNKYTKIVYIDKDKLNKEETKQIIIDYLELSRRETTEQDNITRHSHTTLEEYKKLLEYVINGNNLGIAYSTKERIDNADNTKKR